MQLHPGNDMVVASVGEPLAIRDVHQLDGPQLFGDDGRQLLGGDEEHLPAGRCAQGRQGDDVSVRQAPVDRVRVYGSHAPGIAIVDALPDAHGRGRKEARAADDGDAAPHREDAGGRAVGIAAAPAGAAAAAHTRARGGPLLEAGGQGALHLDPGEAGLLLGNAQGLLIENHAIQAVADRARARSLLVAPELLQSAVDPVLDRSNNNAADAQQVTEGHILHHPLESGSARPIQHARGNVHDRRATPEGRDVRCGVAEEREPISARLPLVGPARGDDSQVLHRPRKISLREVERPHTSIWPQLGSNSAGCPPLFRRPLRQLLSQLLVALLQLQLKHLIVRHEPLHGSLQLLYGLLHRPRNAILSCDAAAVASTRRRDVSPQSRLPPLAQAPRHARQRTPPPPPPRLA
mmetsp:Transcript_168225/g.540464  ORF Transcript_168225/g.540464 Transcript_168225/m.540464 type:complete len:406 (-) Transcript_168225:267-1484(-)